jgi:DNA-binding winged helix-turn-helix (wHTH) protein
VTEVDRGGKTLEGDFRLGDWLVHPALCRLSRNGRNVPVRAKVMDLLTYLASHAGEVVSKDRLLDDVWGSQAVSESALTRTVTELIPIVRISPMGLSRKP